MARNEVERALLRLIEKAEREQEKAARRMTDAEVALRMATSRLQSHKETLRAYREDVGLSDEIGPIDEALRERFAKVSTRDALTVIARDNSGVIAGADAARTLVRAGMFKDMKNASGSIYSAFARYPGIFRKVARGKYQLISSEHKYDVDGGVGSDVIETLVVHDLANGMERAISRRGN